MHQKTAHGKTKDEKTKILIITGAGLFIISGKKFSDSPMFDY